MTDFLWFWFELFLVVIFQDDFHGIFDGNSDGKVALISMMFISF